MLKFLPLLWAGLWHKRGRTILTFLAIVSAFALYGLLQGFVSAIHQQLPTERAERLIVMNSVIQREGMPFAYISRTQQIKGVEQVSFLVGFNSYYQEPRQRFPATAVDPRSYLPFMSEIKLPPEQAEAFANTRTGIVVGKALADQYKLKLGDRITITSVFFPNTDGTRNWQFDIVGIFTVPDSPPQENTSLINYEYLDAGRQINRGLVGQILVRTSDPAQAGSVARDIDKAFENSSYETRTMSQSELAQSQLKAMGDFDSIVRSIVGAVFFALLFSTGMVMVQSIRERGRELAIIKSLGYTDRFLFRLIVAESAFITMTAALLGLVIAFVSFPGVMGMLRIPIAKMPPVVIPIGLAMAALAAIIIAAVPAIKARRLRIVEALAGK